MSAGRWSVGVRPAARSAGQSARRVGVKTTIGLPDARRAQLAPSATVATPKPHGASGSSARATATAPRP